MHIRSWRLWLCLGVLLAATVPWRLLALPEIDAETLDQVAEGYLQIRQTDWLLFVPILILIGVDTVARVRAVGVHPLLFTKPFSPLSFFLACWTGVVVVAGLLAGATLAVRFLIGRFVFGLTLPFAPFGWLLLLVALPTAMAVAAMVIAVRTIVKHNISAYLVSAIFIGMIYGLTDAFDVRFLGWNRELIRPLVQPYLAAVGRDLDWARYATALGHTALLSLLFICFACYHLRRREPQHRVRGRNYGRRWWDMPTFRAFVAGLWPDRHVGVSVHLALIATVATAGMVGFRWLTQRRADTATVQQWAGQLRDQMEIHHPPTPGLVIRRYEGSLEVPRRDTVRCDLRLVVANTTDTTVEQAALTLPFGMEAGSCRSESGGPLRTRQWGNVLVVSFGGPLPSGSTATIRLAYEGRPRVLQIGGLKAPAGLKQSLLVARRAMESWMPGSVGRRSPSSRRSMAVSPPLQYDIEAGHLDELGLVLGSRYVQLSQWLLPRAVALVRGDDGRTKPVEMPRLFTADLRIGLPGGLRTATPDGVVESPEPKGDLSYWRLRIEWPRGDFTLFAGPYETLERQIGPLPLRIECFPPDREIIEFALTELEETVERWGLILGAPKGKGCVLIESPATYRTDDRLPPGILAAADLDRLKRYRRRPKERERETFMALYVYQSKLSAALAGRILRDAFHPDVPLLPLREALYYYLIGTVQRSEVGPNSRKSGRLFQLRRVGDLIAFLDPARAAQFNVPLVLRFGDRTFTGQDAMHIWRMLHYLLEDDKFAALLRSLIGECSDRIVRLPDLEALAERVQGGRLDWFFQQWFFGTGTPRYEILEARATMTENERTRDIEYDVRVVVANRGRGRMPVPIVLQTERDRITRMVWLDSATTETFVVHVPDRPETVFVDPEGWITQETTTDRETRTRGPAWRKVRIIE